MKSIANKPSKMAFMIIYRKFSEYVALKQLSLAWIQNGISLVFGLGLACQGQRP